MAKPSRTPGVPVSLRSAEATTAAERRAYSPVKANNGVPTADTIGLHTQGRRWLHIIVELPDASTSLTWSLWLWDSVSELWCLDTRLGTAGVVAMTDADADNPQHNIVEINGVDKVYIQFAGMTGVFTAGVNVWLSSSNADGG